jgi:multiple sugar transport system substrate-binding protein
MIQLRGITWQHTRGYLPMVATAQRFEETHTGVSINWELRSLQAFADYPIERLAKEFDLLVIDHPFSGRAALGDVLLPLDDFLPDPFLADLAANSVGRSWESYRYKNHLWALPTDAATPISAYRPDLMQKHKVAVPQTWSELLDLAKRGLVALPAIPIDSLMHFYMLCGALGIELFVRRDIVVSEEIGVPSLQRLRELISLCDSVCLQRNPIATWEAMSSGDDIAYCPFAYGYSNYSRPGYARHTLQAGGLLRLDTGEPLRSTLGGAGIAISLITKHREIALEYAEFVASPLCQMGIYFHSGGQPGHRKAWLDGGVNSLSNDFFRATLPTLDSAYVRPRFDGYLHFQENAALAVHRYLIHGDNELQVLNELNRLLCAARRRIQEEEEA